jgi:hypothetical protein
MQGIMIICLLDVKVNQIERNRTTFLQANFMCVLAIAGMAVA